MLEAKGKLEKLGLDRFHANEKKLAAQQSTKIMNMRKELQKEEEHVEGELFTKVMAKMKIVTRMITLAKAAQDREVEKKEQQDQPRQPTPSWHR